MATRSADGVARPGVRVLEPRVTVDDPVLRAPEHGDDHPTLTGHRQIEA